MVLLKAAVESTWTDVASGLSVRLNNNAAFDSRENGRVDPALSRCLFTQTFHQLSRVPAKRLCAKLDEKQRLFEVKFEGEEGLDWGGLYREGLYCCVEDLFSGRDVNLFLLCPNGQNEAQLVGSNTDKFLPNPRHSSPLAMQMFEFVGKLMGISIRTKALLPFEFAPLVWKILAGEKLTVEDLENVDVQLAERLRNIAAGAAVDAGTVGDDGEPTSDAVSATEAFSAQFPDLYFVVPGSDRHAVELIPGGANLRVNYLNRRDYVELATAYRLEKELRPAVEAIGRGLFALVPKQALRVLTAEELEIAVSGSPTIDIGLLKKHTTYHGYTATHVAVKRFWRVMESMGQNDRQKFIRFVWGRSRLPREADWGERPFKLTKVNKTDNALPLAHTCFFQIELPPYSTDAIMRQRLLAAIHFSGSEFMIK